MSKARPIPFVDPDATLFVHAAVSIGTRLDELISFEPCLADANSVYELHQMRIAAKRLRYTMDLFQSAFDDFSRHGKEFAAAVSEIKLLQEHLGNIHDADVLAPKLAAQLRKVLAAAHGKDKHDEPLVGVHLVDFDACQGLLTLCIKTRNDRDASFESLKSDWNRLVEEQIFDQWRKLLRKAITDETLAAALHEPLPSGPISEDSADRISIKVAATEPNAPHTNGEHAMGNDSAHQAPNPNGEAVDEKPRVTRESRNGKTTRGRAARKPTAGATDKATDKAIDSDF